jgi:hypothetical protein
METRRDLLDQIQRLRTRIQDAEFGAIDRQLFWDVVNFSKAVRIATDAGDTLRTSARELSELFDDKSLGVIREYVRNDEVTESMISEMQIRHPEMDFYVDFGMEITKVEWRSRAKPKANW